jgi:hypothetical protein
MRLGALHQGRLSLPVNFFQAVTDELYQFTGHNTRKLPGNDGRSDTKDFTGPPPRHRVKKKLKTPPVRWFFELLVSGKTPDPPVLPAGTPGSVDDCPVFQFGGL